MIAYGRAGKLSEARALYEELRQLSQSHPEEPAVREAQAKDAVNLISVTKREVYAFFG
jgi:pentatricopeptide repeat protein